ncbi:TrkH family potassium uptake protein [bacterium]|nr:TrkH family potassium uptake protein [bacterium]
MRSSNRRYLIHRLLVVTGSLGRLLGLFGLVLIVPGVVGLLYGEVRVGLAFVVCGAVTALGGGVLRRKLPRGRLGTREAILLCTGAWAVCSLLAAIPLHLTSPLRGLDAIFECVSGLTTTGLTVLQGLDNQPHAIIFWRSLSQLLGGLGILSFFLLVSYPGSAAHRLLQTESTMVHVPRPTPSLQRTVAITWMIYGVLLVANLVVLLILGVGGFQAINYAFTTTSTGGFAPHDLGVGQFAAAGHPNAYAIELATIVFMLLGGINYLLHYRALTGRVSVLLTATEPRRYWLLLLGALALVTVEALALPQNWEALAQAGPTGTMGGSIGFTCFRIASFQTASLVSSAGHVTVPLHYSFFGPAARQVFMGLLMLGGCAGSTAGGLKIVRAAVLGKSLIQETRKLSHPEGSVLPVVLDRRVIEARVVQSMAAMAFAWIVFTGVGGVLMALDSSHGGFECLSLSVSALSNTGPSLMPMQQTALLPPLSKVVLMVWMIAGRLEILPVLALFSARTWHQ